MKLLKTVLDAVGGAMTFLLWTVTVIFVVLAVAGHANVGCTKGWFANSPYTCSATVFIPSR